MNFNQIQALLADPKANQLSAGDWNNLRDQAQIQQNTRYDPSMAAASVAANPRGSIPTPPQNNQWPTFRNDMERNIAIDNGSYDPSYPTPLAKVAALSDQTNNLQTLAAAASSGANAFPYNAATTPQEQVRAQLSGDVYGDTKKILTHLQGLDYPKQLDQPMTPTPRAVGTQIFMDSRADLQPYSPTGGYGGKPLEDGMKSPLDFNIVNDKEFQKLMGTDPHRASFVYKKLTGRDYTSDTDLHSKIQNERTKIGVGFVTDAIKNGAQIDPITGKAHIWQNVEPDPGAIGGNGQPTRKLVPASPEQQMYFDKHYSDVTGKAYPKANPAVTKVGDYVQQKLGTMSTAEQAAAQADIDKAQKDTGKILNPMEKLAIVANAQKKVAPDNSILRKVGTGFEETGRAIMGYQNVPETEDVFSTEAQSHRNAWGRMVDQRLIQPTPDEIAAHIALKSRAQLIGQPKGIIINHQ